MTVKTVVLVLGGLIHSIRQKSLIFCQIMDVLVLTSRHLAQKSVTDLLRDNCGCITQENNETGSDYFTFADNFGSICGNRSTGNFSMISLKESQTAEIFRRRPFMGLFLITHCWFCIFATILIVGFLPNVLTIFLGILIIGSRQQALLVLMHEAAHGNLFEHKFFNYWAAQLLCAYPVFADTKVYRSIMQNTTPGHKQKKIQIWFSPVDIQFRRTV